MHTQGVKHRDNIPEVLTSEHVFTEQPDHTLVGLVLQAGGWKRIFVGAYDGGKRYWHQQHFLMKKLC